MKVGTDGTILGAWANGGMRILDIGTGTGLIALMMAQRYPQAKITAIDVDSEACLQAHDNVLQSPFHERVTVIHTPLQLLEGDGFDAMVCNPPFYADSLRCPDARRNCARHADTLTYAELFSHAARLMNPHAELSLVIPAQCYKPLDTQAALAGFRPSRVCAVITAPQKPPRRYLLAYVRHRVTSVEETTLNLHSDACKQMLNDFYL